MTKTSVLDNVYFVINMDLHLWHWFLVEAQICDAISILSESQRAWGCSKLLTTTRVTHRDLGVWLLGLFDIKVAHTGRSTPPWTTAILSVHISDLSCVIGGLTLGMPVFMILGLWWVRCLNHRMFFSWINCLMAWSIETRLFKFSFISC